MTIYRTVQLISLLTSLLLIMLLVDGSFNKALCLFVGAVNLLLIIVNFTMDPYGKNRRIGSGSD